MTPTAFLRKRDMCFFFSFVPATCWAIIGYFILFSSTRADGAVKTFGQVLSVWVLVMAAMFVVGGAYVSLAGFCSMESLSLIHI